MKKGLIFIACAAICLALYSVGRENPSELQKAVDSGDILRLHVVAASDDPYDQETKLAVRDAVLAYCGPKLEAASGRSAMLEVVESELANIERIAGEAASKRSYSGPVTATFGKYAFPEREYAGEIVPAGTYQALRIVLGDGKGANWWCVMYPPLCFVGEKAVAPGEKIEVKFTSKIASWWNSRSK